MSPLVIRRNLDLEVRSSENLENLENLENNIDVIVCDNLGNISDFKDEKKLYSSQKEKDLNHSTFTDKDNFNLNNKKIQKNYNKGSQSEEKL